MSDREQGVYRAIERWEAKGLISADLAATLRGEVSEASDDSTRRLAQYVLAVTGAFVLLLAGGVFMAWAWPLMADEGQALFLAVAGAGVQYWGTRLEWRRRWVPASYLMQSAGLALVWGALAWSGRAWPDETAAGVAAGVVAMAYVVTSSVRAIRRSAFMPAVHLVFVLGYLALVLDRSLGLAEEEIVWVLDAVLLVAAVLLVGLLRRDPHGESHPWALAAFVAAAYTAFFLIWGTSVLPLDLAEAVIIPLDLWLFGMAALTLWGIHGAPPGLRREWFGRQLAWLVGLWIPMGFYTAFETLDGSSELAVLMVGGVGVAGFLYADRTRTGTVMTASALAFVCPLWWWGADRAGVLGAVLALGATAAFLFWLSGRWGGADEGAETARAD